MANFNIIKLLTENLSVGNPTAIFICFTSLILFLVFPFVFYAEIAKKKIKKQNKKKPSNKQKIKKETSHYLQKNKSSQKRTSSKPLIPTLDTESSGNEEPPFSEKESQFVPSTKRIQALTYDIDQNDFEGWKVVQDKKSKRSHTETSIESIGNEELDKSVSKPKNRQIKHRRPINRVPGMTD
ncbi:putative integral membrane protein [Cryptosporidium felis]|nr:putative integral membrane protein [Cryptosporidium felis]